ncbi:MAG: glutamine-hydrolyzing GMP synthase [Candidatus Muirbacterium halophilum]|nr:glutamine-hydrolyzing GMP synthase [Candidatus Muirbacterium halophilum]MCK9474938.1 glutamine-hydrolyzing GMP synthase [Candidatus Muirbacterium halophilum]
MGEYMNNVMTVDFGSQYSQLIIRKLRESGYYSELVPFDKAMDYLKQNKPKAIIFSGGPNSVYEKNSPSISMEIFKQNIPILGICYGMQLIAKLHGGKIENSGKREYGYAEVKKVKDDLIFENINDFSIWMSHGDSITKMPEGFELIATTEYCPGIIKKQNIYGLQFHPEVHHSKNGTQFIINFLKNIAGLTPDWSMDTFLENEIKTLKEKIKDKKVICALSGGVDSSVMTALLAKVAGKQLTAIFVDNGLLRKNEKEFVYNNFKNFDFELKIIDAQDEFLNALKGITDPEQKRKIIGKVFIDVFEREAKDINAYFLAQGTLYPDVIESVSHKGPSQIIKSHHNVGGLPEKMNLKIIEPFRTLFKDEVRILGEKLGLPKKLIQRHPFPGPGLAVRILGDIDREKLYILKEADAIMIDEIEKAGYYNQIWQALCVLTPIKTVGVMGDQRTYERVLAIRMVDSVDGMTADFIRLPYNILAKISSRIIGEVRGINRVVYDITSKPPATIEWE